MYIYIYISIGIVVSFLNASTYYTILVKVRKKQVAM